MSDQRYEPQWEQSKYRKVTKPLRTKAVTIKSCGKRDPEWKIPDKIDITVELDSNQPPTIGELIGTKPDFLMLGVLQEREQQRLKWEAEREEAVQPKSQPDTKPEEPAAPVSWFARTRAWFKAHLS